MKYFAGILLFTFIIQACNESGKTKNTSINSQDTVHFYPVTEYLKQQIAHTDSIPYFIYRIRIVNGKKDSSVVDVKTFDSLANEFVRDDISNPAIKKYYTENIFEDASTNSYTISYTIADTSLPIQNIDVLLNTDDQKVKWIFMNRNDTLNGRMISKKLGWQPDKKFYINSVTTDKNGRTIEEENTIVWNNKD